MEDFLLQNGIWILGLVFLLDDLGFPVPAGTALFIGAINARTSPLFPVWLLFTIAIATPFIGNSILFFAGRHGAKRWLHTHGHHIFLPEERLLKMEKFFQKRHGWLAIFLASMVTNMRPFFAVIAGGSSMSLRKFWTANISGITCWASIIIGAGYLLGEHAKSIWHKEWPVIITIIIALITGWAWLKIINKFFKLHHRK